VADLEDDTFIESDGQNSPMSAFSQTLSKFKKSPKKKGWFGILDINNYRLTIY